MAEEKEEQQLNIFESGLVSKHEILTEGEKETFLTNLNISLKQLPRIKHDDPVIKQLAGKRHDVVRITRADPNTGQYYYYRVVV